LLGVGCWFFVLGSWVGILLVVFSCWFLGRDSLVKDSLVVVESVGAKHSGVRAKHSGNYFDCKKRELTARMLCPYRKKSKIYYPVSEAMPGGLYASP
jgi:hypothetical protein